jgi:hypothetical protein
MTISKQRIKRLEEEYNSAFNKEKIPSIMLFEFSDGSYGNMGKIYKNKKELIKEFSEESLNAHCIKMKWDKTFKKQYLDR